MIENCRYREAGGVYIERQTIQSSLGILFQCLLDHVGVVTINYFHLTLLSVLEMFLFPEKASSTITADTTWMYGGFNIFGSQKQLYKLHMQSMTWTLIEVNIPNPGVRGSCSLQ